MIQLVANTLKARLLPGTKKKAPPLTGDSLANAGAVLASLLALAALVEVLLASHRDS